MPLPHNPITDHSASATSATPAQPQRRQPPPHPHCQPTAAPNTFLKLERGVGDLFSKGGLGTTFSKKRRLSSVPAWIQNPTIARKPVWGRTEPHRAAQSRPEPPGAARSPPRPPRAAKGRLKPLRNAQSRPGLPRATQSHPQFPKPAYCSLERPQANQRHP